MRISEQEINEKAEKITELLQKAIETAEHDRTLALNNYKDLKAQLDAITGSLGLHMSEECSLEKEINTALKLVFQSSERLDKVIKITSDIMINQLNNLTKEKIAKTFATAREITGPVDIEKFKRKSVVTQLMDDSKKYGQNEPSEEEQE